jgi:hypothetical protein
VAGARSWYQELSDRAASEAETSSASSAARASKLAAFRILRREVVNDEGTVKYPQVIGFIYAEDQFLARRKNISSKYSK